MRRVLSLLVVGLLTASFVFAGGQQESGATDMESAEEPAFVVGINNFGQANFFARIGRTTLIEEVEKRGGRVISSVTADVPSRTSAVENFIAQGVDAIIIQEGDISQIAPAMREADRQGIIIGSMDAGDADFVDVFAESNNEQLGRMAAEKLVEAMNEQGKIVEIFNDAGAMIRQRKNAMHEVVDQYPDVEVEWGFVYAWPDFFPDSKGKMESLIQANPEPGEISGVYATFDGVGIAAAQAVREAGLQEHIKIVGIDGDPNAYEEMREPDSPFVATVAQDPEGIAKAVVDGVFKLLRGEELEERHIYIPGVLITKDNIPET